MLQPLFGLDGKQHRLDKLSQKQGEPLFLATRRRTRVRREARLVQNTRQQKTEGIRVLRIPSINFTVFFIINKAIWL